MSLLVTEFPRIWNELWYAFVNEDWATQTEAVTGIIMITIIGLVSFVEGILMIYLALATGQLPIFAKHRDIIAFIMFFVINLVLQIITGGCAYFLPSTMSAIGAFSLSFIYILIIDVILFILIKVILDKHLNLE